MLDFDHRGNSWAAEAQDGGNHRTIQSWGLKVTGHDRQRDENKADKWTRNWSNRRKQPAGQRRIGWERQPDCRVDRQE